MSLGAHLVELRKRLTRSALAIVGGTVIGWMIYDLTWIGNLLDPALPGAAKALADVGTWAALREPILRIAEAQGTDVAINFTTITGALDIQFQVALATGIVLSSPVWLYQLFAFFVPGLTGKERRYTFGFFFTAIPLFLAGGANGRHKGGMHVASNGDPVSRVSLTAQQLIGMPVGEFGVGSMKTAKPISDVVV